MAITITNAYFMVLITGVYVFYREGDYVEYEDGVDVYRDGVRSGDFVIDKELTATGFAGTENVDWENVRIDAADNGTTWRKGFRNDFYVIDKTLTVIGFSGVEDTDWENVRQI